MQQGRAAACHALGLVLGASVDRTASSAVYGLPEIAGVGATEEQVKASGTPYVIGRSDLAATARGASAGHGGRLKLIFRSDDRKLLGVHCIGDIASELVGMGHVAMHLGGTVDIFLTLALNTPTYSYAYRDAAIDGLARLRDQIKRRPGAVAKRGPNTTPAVPG
jgi:NAD(P) transhydrogenase